MAEHYKLIENDAINVLVPYDRKVFDALRDEMTSAVRPQADVPAWLDAPRDAAQREPFPAGGSGPYRPLSVARANGFGEIELAQAEWAIALPGLEYDRLLGLAPPSDNLLIG